MMIWHVGLGASNAFMERFVGMGLRNGMISAWSHYEEAGRLTENKRSFFRSIGGRIFVDSGALSALRIRPARLDWLARQDEIAALARRTGADFVSHLDVPMERRGLANAGLSRKAALDTTIRNARDFMDADTVPARKVYVIQGWSIDEYRRCLRAFLDLGLPDGGGFGLGTCCMRMGTRGLWQIAEWARGATEGEWLHAFGVGDVAKVPRLARIGFDSISTRGIRSGP